MDWKTVKKACVNSASRSKNAMIVDLDISDKNKSILSKSFVVV